MSTSSIEFDVDFRLAEKVKVFEPLLPYAWAARTIRRRAFWATGFVVFVIYAALLFVGCLAAVPRLIIVYLVGVPMFFTMFAGYDRGLLRALTRSFEYV